MTIEELKNQIREKSEKLMSAFSEIIKANGGEVGNGVVLTQPFELDGLESPIRLGIRYLGDGEVPIIIMSSQNCTSDEAEKFSELLTKVMTLVKQAEQQSGVTAQEILKLEEELNNARRTMSREEAKRRAAEFAALPGEELLWQHDKIQVLLKREGGEYDEKWGKVRGHVYLAVRKNGREETFYPQRYITESGAFQRKKFLEREQWFFEDHTEEVAEFIKAWHEKIDEERRKYLR